MIPFFVVDRPINLRILGSYFEGRSDLKLGLMTHAQTTANFKSLYASFWKEGVGNEAPEHISDKAALSNTNGDGRAIKMVDSGIFRSREQRGGYESLFETYDKMGADFGIVIDFMRDKKQTLVSAEEALQTYERREHAFRLVTVAQGNSIEAYAECYENLKDLGSDYIALGGLLKKRENSARFINLRDENEMKAVLEHVHKEHDPEWLFVLGAYHPSRHDFFSQHGVWGSDYKGWIFKYTDKFMKLEALQNELANIHGFHLHDKVLNTLTIRRAGASQQLKRYQKEYNAAPKDTKQKKDAWLSIAKTKSKCLRYDQKIFARHLACAREHSVSEEYTQKLGEALQILNKTESTVRADGLHDYLDALCSQST